MSGAADCKIVPIGSCPGKVLDLKADGTAAIIGRSETATLQLDHPAISRQHASICFQNGKWVLTDLGSRHGTMLNGIALPPRQPTPLRPSDRIVIRPWSIRFDQGGMAAPTVVQSSAESYSNTVCPVAEAPLAGTAQRQLDLLIEASMAIHSSESESDLATHLTKFCVEGTSCERALFVRFLAGEGTMEVLGAWPQNAAQRRPVSRTLLRAAVAGKPVRLSEDASFGAAASIVGTGINGALCIPIMIDGHAEAFLYLDQFDSMDGFKELSSFSQALARLSGLAILKIRRVELESRQRELLDELASARRVQERIMGNGAGNNGTISWKMCSIPGQVVAGDIFGIRKTGTEGKVAVFLGDVSGKGLGPGLLMAAITAHLEATLASGVHATKAIFDLSNFVAARAIAGQFATFALAEADPSTNVVSLFDAGHGYFVVVTASGQVKAVESNAGVPIGVLEDFDYEKVEVKLEAGDRLVLFSDGVAEQRNESGEMMGMERVEEALTGSKTCEEDVDRLEKYLRTFAGPVKYADDVTIASVMFAQAR